VLFEDSRELILRLPAKLARKDFKAWTLGRRRVHGRSQGKETPIGWTPHYEDIEWKGLDFPKEKFEKLQLVDRTAWKSEVIGHEELFILLHAHLPPEMIYERELLICRL